MTEPVLEPSRQRTVDPGQQLAAAPGDADLDYPPVVAGAPARDQALGLEAVQQPGHVGHRRDHPLADLTARQPLGVRTPEDAQGVVLSGRQAVGLEEPGVLPVEQRGAAQEVQERLLRAAGERPALADLASQMVHHGRYPVAGVVASAGSSSGSVCSIRARWGSSQAGSLSAAPSFSGLSSTVNPGGSVAISNSTPPGSRK